MRVSLKRLGYKVFRIFIWLLLLLSGFLIINVNLWASIVIIAVFSAAIAAEVYTEIRYIYSDKKERQRMDNQKPLLRYYYDRWYKPADSTLSTEQQQELKKIKKKFHKR